VRVTVCELPHDLDPLERAWSALCAHTSQQGSHLVVLPEVPFSGPLWISEEFDPGVWLEAEAAHARWLPRLSELGATWVIGTRPVRVGPDRFNEGFLWSTASGLIRLRRKYFLPNEPDGWEARWFARGDAEFPRYEAGELSFGLNICTELWALESFGRYRHLRVDAIVAPRATAAATTEKWLALGTVAAASAGTYCVSSNRVQADGSCGGVGWVIDPDGRLLARTSPSQPYCTVDLDLARVQAAAQTYPRYVFKAF
jgi:N-carbamoylputrescine amidase